MPKTIAAAFVAAALATGMIGASGVVTARVSPHTAASAGLPDALKREAIATRSEPHGQIAGARIGNTDTYVVYIRTIYGCGSGGCRAQIWICEGGRFVPGGSLPVGRLPLVVLPQTSNGMPLLGVTIFDKLSARPVILPVGFDGQNYTQELDDHLLPADSGKPLLTVAMLRSF